jgi:phosphatidylglycerol:prolipoprotein diacylglycerol transferase
LTCSGNFCLIPRVIATVHSIDPVIFDIWGPVKLRWYGLAYLLAFVVGYYLLRFLSRRGLWVIAENKIGDFIALLAMLGVFLGGRLGYVLFYMIPKEGWSVLARDPLVTFKVWEGGMASHGGFLGVAIFTYFYARKHRVSWTGIGDGICIVAPLGLMFGRIANFINGELYGRAASGVPWAMKFPHALAEEPVEKLENLLTATAERAPMYQEMVATPEGLTYAVRESATVREIAEQYLTARHPSQLYEALLEGAVLFAVMWVLRFRYPKAPHGMICGVFFILYGAFRTFVELYREPDSSLIVGLTKGQFYSLFMIVAGVAFLIHASRSKPAEPESNKAQ